MSTVQVHLIGERISTIDQEFRKFYFHNEHLRLYSVGLITISIYINKSPNKLTVFVFQLSKRNYNTIEFVVYK